MTADLYIGLRLPRGFADQFPPDEERGEPHVTVVYAVDVEAPFETIRKVIEAVVAEHPPIALQLGGGEVEYLTGKKRPRAAVVPVESAALVALRHQLRGALADHSIETPQTYSEFAPHVTVAYVGDEDFVGPVPTGLCVAVDVEVRFGDEVAALNLGQSDKFAARVEPRELRWGADLEEDAKRRAAGVRIPDGWVIGKPFRCLATGEVYQRVSAKAPSGRRFAAGERRSQPITREHLESIILAFDAGEEVPINWDHKPPSMGTVVAAWLVDGGESLAVVPAYNPTLSALVARSSGALWSSPEINWGAVHHPATGARLGTMLMDGLALTDHPAQAHTKLDRVRLNTPRGDDAPPNGAEEAPDMEETNKLLAALLAANQENGKLLSAIMDKLAGGEASDGEDAPEASPDEGAASMSSGVSATDVEQIVTAAIGGLKLEHQEQLTKLQGEVRLAQAKGEFAELMAARLVQSSDETRFLADHRRAHAEEATDEDRELLAEWRKRSPLAPAERTSHGHSDPNVDTDPMSPAAIHKLATEQYGGDYAKAAAAQFKAHRGR